MTAPPREEKTRIKKMQDKALKLSVPMGSACFALPIPYRFSANGAVCCVQALVQKPCFASASIVYRPIVKIV